MNNHNNLIGKNILIFDVETTGLPTRKNYYATGIDEYYDPTDLSKYNTSRIVSIAYVYVEKFNIETLSKSKIIYKVRKPLDFVINNESVKIHGITTEYAKLNGKILSIILNDFSEKLSNCDYIVAHNALFDIHVLLSEMHRINFESNFENLKFHLDEKKYLCTGELGRNICKIPTKQYNTQYKMPKLSELYNKVCGNDNLEFHNAKNDVYAIVKILSELIKK